MIGLIALGFVALAVWIAKRGWQSYRDQTPSGGRSVMEVIAFFALSALVAGVVFVSSAAIFSGQEIYVMTFAVFMTLLNIGGLSLLSLPARALPVHGVYISDMLRIGPVFFILYWFAFAKDLMKILGIRGGS